MYSSKQKYSTYVGIVISTSALLLAVAQPAAAQGGINGYARADPSPAVIGEENDCVALIGGSADAASAECQLFTPSTPLGQGVPAATLTATFVSNPPTLSDVPGECANDPQGCDEFRATFSGSYFTQPGDYHYRIVFYDSAGNVINITGADFRIHSFFVIPESYLGAVAIVGASLGTIGAYSLLKTRSHKKLAV